MIAVILDYSVGEVIIKDIPQELEGLDDGDMILTDMGYKLSNIEYMIADNSLSISIDTKCYSSKLTLK